MFVGVKIDFAGCFPCRSWSRGIHYLIRIGLFEFGFWALSCACAAGKVASA